MNDLLSMCQEIIYEIILGFAWWWCPLLDERIQVSLSNFLKTFIIKKKLSIEIIKEKIKIIFCGFVLIILSKESVGKKPPVDTIDMVRFNELNILTSEKLRERNNRKLNTE